MQSTAASATATKLASPGAVQCNKSPMATDGALLCSCNCSQECTSTRNRWLVRFRPEGTLILAVIESVMEVSLKNITSCFHRSDKERRKTTSSSFLVGARWNNPQDARSVRLPCSAASNAEVAALTIFDIIMGNQDRIAAALAPGELTPAHNVFVRFQSEIKGAAQGKERLHL